MAPYAFPFAKRTKRYPGLPARIFGIKSASHKAYMIKKVLGYYKKRFREGSTKYQLLRHLVKLEAEITQAESDAVGQWLGEDYSFEGKDDLIAHLNDLRGILPPIDCCVCMDTLGAELFPQHKITELCNHAPTVCRNCLTQSIDTQIPDVAWDQLRCPECPETLPYDVVKEWASPAAFERYDQKSLLAAFRDMPNFAMCLGPGCDSGQIHETGDAQPIMTCTICHFKTCFTHKMPWHQGQTCAQYDFLRKERMEQEAASENLIAKTTKKCPNPKCGHGIEKKGGCDHMTCKQCHYGFCYVCLASWKVIMREGNTAHAQDCKYHSDRLNAGPAPAIIIPDEDDEAEDDESEAASDNEIEDEIGAAPDTDVEDENEIATDTEIESDIEVASVNEILDEIEEFEEEIEEMQEEIDDIEESVAAVAARWDRLIRRH